MVWQVERRRGVCVSARVHPSEACASLIYDSTDVYVDVPCIFCQYTNKKGFLVVFVLVC